MIKDNNYYHIDRREWQNLGQKEKVRLTEAELTALTSLNDRISLEDVREVYLPLLQLFDLYLQKYRQQLQEKSRFLNREYVQAPFIIGVTGSVAVGKSTTARLLQNLLQQAYPDKKVELVTTDGFLYPNAVLEEKGIMDRKGFPESYDMETLVNFLLDVKTGKPEVKMPVYSHHIYDIVPNEYHTMALPDMLIVEGINVLQLPANQEIYVSDFFDYSIYVDAEEELIEKWYLERFEMLMDLAKDQPDNYYHDYAIGDRREAIAMARGVWQRVNLTNLREYIQPTIWRADLIIHKSRQHYIDHLYIKKY